MNILYLDGETVTDRTFALHSGRRLLLCATKCWCYIWSSSHAGSSVWCRTVGDTRLRSLRCEIHAYIFHAKQKKKLFFLKKFRRKQKKFTCHEWPASNDIYRANWIILPEKDRWPALISRLGPVAQSVPHKLVSFKWLTWAWSTSFCLIVSSPRQATSWYVAKSLYKLETASETSLTQRHLPLAKISTRTKATLGSFPGSTWKQHDVVLQVTNSLLTVEWRSVEHSIRHKTLTLCKSKRTRMTKTIYIHAYTTLYLI